MSNWQQKLGKWGETLAAKYLVKKGYIILDRNAYTRYGELDLVALHEDVIVFVEVKTRTSMRYGYPEVAVTFQKQSHLLDAATQYLQDHPELDENWRIDVIAIQAFKDDPPEIVHFENAVI